MLRVNGCVRGVFAALAVITVTGCQSIPFLDRASKVPQSEDGLLIGPGVTSVPFVKDDYLDEWAQETGECLNTRDLVLIEESVEPVTFVTSAECVLLSGRWYDLYTNDRNLVEISDPDDLVIDHIVSLKEAHLSGAWSWKKTKKAEFANDLDNLIAVRLSSAKEKGSKDVTHFLPPHPDAQCAFILAGVLTKRKWNLTFDESEAAEIKKFDAVCDFDGMERELKEAAAQ